MAAGLELFERSNSALWRPEWNMISTVVGGEHVPVAIASVWERPFCRLHFERAFEHAPRMQRTHLLIVAPMSGHYPTLLRGTVKAFCQHHHVYITEWEYARMVQRPVSEGSFDLDEYIDYLISMMHVLGGDVHVLAVCSLQCRSCCGRANGELRSHSIVLVGGPIDTRENPTQVNKLAETRGIDWFANVITKVPFPDPGFMRDVYPGFLQLHGFVSVISTGTSRLTASCSTTSSKAMAIPRNIREFYDEYLAVIISPPVLSANGRYVFVGAACPRARCSHRSRADPPRRLAHSGRARTTIQHGSDRGGAQALRQRERKAHWLQPAVGRCTCAMARGFVPRSCPAFPTSVLSNTTPARARPGASLRWR